MSEDMGGWLLGNEGPVKISRAAFEPEFCLTHHARQAQGVTGAHEGDYSWGGASGAHPPLSHLST